MSQSEHAALTAAAEAGLRAPSVFNTQPWQWCVDAQTLELHADWDRMLPVTDPRGRLLLLSCGAALHHARVALAALGWRVSVDRFPDPSNAALLARIRLVERIEASEEAGMLYQAIAARRTDRRPFGDEPVPDTSVRRLVEAAEREGVHLHDVRIDQMPMLAVAVASAESQHSRDEAYRGELMRWTNRPSWSRDGVPQTTGVAHVPRRVPVRDFVFAPNAGIPVEPGGDRGARFLVLYGDADTPADWLRAGEGTSAVLLAAVSLGLAVAPISEVVEVEHPRALVARLLPGGFPYLVIRCGVSSATTPLDPAPRRDAADTVRGPQP